MKYSLNWKRALLAGFLGSAVLMAYTDIFNMLGMLPFSFELYFGSLVQGTTTQLHAWTWGLLINWVLGAGFGILYALLFEYTFHKSSVRLGVLLGFAHAAIAAFLLFPFFGVIREFMESDTYRHFGVLGSSINVSVPIFLTFGHVLFGITVGFVYGPVGIDRIASLRSEPGEWAEIGDPSAIDHNRDAEDHREVYPAA